MKLLAEISDKTLGLSDFEILGAHYELRKSARAILRKPDGTIAVLYLQNHFLHKLPGGGVEKGESIEEAVVREIKEEVGCDIILREPIGIVIEYRKEQTLLHISHCYIADVVGDIGPSNLEQAEIDEGMITIWITPEEAIQKMEADTPNTYQGPFITQRELAFLREFVAMR
jgi:8-oxo-dGTP diphosphatase